MRTCYKEIMPNDSGELKKHLQSALELIDELSAELKRCQHHGSKSLGKNIGGIIEILDLRRKSIVGAIESSPDDADASDKFLAIR